MWSAIIGAFFKLLQFAGQMKANSDQNQTNIDMQRMANAANLRSTEMANAAQAAESEKAYQRSMASNQVNLMRAAGMSKAGALNALNGGGVYTPAPVNVAQVQAPQVDNSGMREAFGSLGSISEDFANGFQMKQAQKQFEADLDLRKKAQELERYNIEERLKLEREKFVEEQLNNASMRSLNEASISKIAKDMELTDAQVKQLAASTDLTWQQLQTEMEKTKLTAQQILDIQEHTNLTTQQILESRAKVNEINANTARIYQEIENLKSQKNLTDAQVDSVKQAYNQCQQRFDRLFAGEVARDQLETEMKQIQKDMLIVAKGIQADEATIKSIEALNVSADYYVYGHGTQDIVHKFLNEWSYQVGKLIPLKGLVSFGGK